ncbi:MAG TPA: hypothetical protein VN025_08720 [Candidatus Dormibacteraeota bacterium]|jgi:hypothetical protein|nr:hypothetical protein [Candidatus Dormibacteraeota bacterium]
MSENRKICAAERTLLRHTLATVAYRGGKALRGAPESFGNFGSGDGGRTPVQILAHLCDLYDWALSIVSGKQAWRDSPPLPWEKEVERFFASLKKFDEYLASGAELYEGPAALFQGPIADSLTHIGQIAMLRRMAGHKIKGENYHQAEIVAGRVGVAQATPRREF